MDSIKADHGYNLDSKSVQNLLQTMSELDPQAKRDFLQFVTGSPKLPIGGKDWLLLLGCDHTNITHRFQEFNADVYRGVQAK